MATPYGFTIPENNPLVALIAGWQRENPGESLSSLIREALYGYFEAHPVVPNGGPPCNSNHTPETPICQTGAEK